MSGLFPGASTPKEFWENLLSDEVSISTSTAEDFGADPAWFYDPKKGAVDRCYSLSGGYIRDFHFDPEGYALPADFLARQDKLYQWALHVSREALRDSGYDRNEAILQRCGVILGELSFPTQSSHKLLGGLYARTLEKALQELLEEKAFKIPLHDGQSTEGDVLTHGTSEIVKEALRLGASHYSLDAACASTLYAIKMACDELITGKADLMLAGAVCGSDQLFIHMGFSIFQAYAESGSRFAPLDQHTGGLVSSEGAGMLVLKRLNDALADGDDVLAVIEGIGLSNDGKGKFLLSPNPAGQQLALERAYAAAQADPAETTFIECHATGTPLGDRTEVNTIARFFSPYETAPFLGAVKANVGHLLTAASIPAIMKVILSMQKELIPGTPDIENPIVAKDGPLASEQILTQPTPWKPSVKQAGVNAFGFGGTNAHLILKAGEGPALAVTPSSTPVLKPLAITGMAIHCAGCEELEDFYQTVYAGQAHLRPLPAKRWKGFDGDPALLKQFGFADGKAPEGGYIENFDVDLLRFKIHPKELETMEPQQALILKVADQALKDAGIQLEAKANVAVLIAMESELAIHHYLARWDMSWQLRQALEQSGLELTEEKYEELEDICKNVMFSREGAQTPSQHTSFVGNIMASRISALWDFSGPSFTISGGMDAAFKALEVAQHLLSLGEVEAVVVGGVDLAGGLENVLLRNRQAKVRGAARAPGEGAGAVVLKRSEDVKSEKVYAVIEQVGQLNIEPQNNDYLEIAAPLTADQFLNRIGPETPSGAIAVGSAQKNVGFTFAASGIISLIRSALSLHYRFIPASRGWTGAPPSPPSPFYTPLYSRPWILQDGQEKRRSVVMGEDGNALQLAEATKAGQPDNSFLNRNLPLLFPVRGNSVEQLLGSLSELGEKLQQDENLAALAIAHFHQIKEKTAATFQLCLVARNAGELHQEIAFFNKNLHHAVDNGRLLKTPKGSFFTPKPMGKKGKIAFVYPGSSTAYEGLGKDLFQLFPELHSFFEEKLPSIAPYLQEKYLYPRVSDPGMAGPDIQQDVIAMMTSGIFFSTAYTHILRSVFRLEPDIAFGYSMGECSSMWFATGVWEGVNAEHTLRESGVFSRRIAGDLEAVAELWDVSTEEVREKWRSYVVLAPVDQIKSAMRGRERVYLTFINTPEEAVISGDKAGCLEIIGRLGKPHFEVPFQNAIHHDFCRAEEEGLLAIHSYPISAQNNIRFFSSIDLAPIDLNSKQLARNATEVCCRVVDFPRTVQAVYEEGARLFIEVGPQTSCSGWIGRILQGKEHAALPFNQKGKSDADNLAALLAGLISHGVELDLSSIFDPADVQQEETKHFTQSLTLGGERVFETILSQENRRKFRPLRKETAVAAAMAGRSSEYLAAATYSGKETRTILGDDGKSSTIVSRVVQTKKEKNTSNMDQQEKTSQLPAAVNGKERIGENGLRLQDYEAGEHLQGKEIIFSQADLEEFAGGKISNVFGKEYAEIDNYRRIVRLPMHPYLLVSRVTRLDAQMGVYEPCSIQTEYDIPYGAWYTTDGQIPWAVAVESGQCDLLLISYLGIDFENKGERVYRLLDCTLTFVDDFPYEGQTLRYDISINSFVRHGDALLFFFSYRCYVEDRLFLKMDGGCAGFFSDEDLAAGKGVIYSEKELEVRRNAQKRHFVPFLHTKKTSFSKEDMNYLIDGAPHKCFEDETYFPNGRNPSLRLPPRQILMLDRVVSVDTQGGAYGLGAVVAEKDLSPDDWYFPCHFKDDEVLAGSLVAEGGGNLLRFYMMMLGLQRLTKDARFQPVYDLPQKVRVRRQINKDNKILTYKLEVKDIGLIPNPYVIADLEILVDGVPSVHFENLGLQIREKATPRYLDKHDDVVVSARSEGALLNEKDITTFALGSLEDAFGPDFSVYNGRSVSRQPNTDLQFISRVLSVDGQRRQFSKPSTIVAEYDVPEKVWYYEQNNAPTMPYSVLMEIALQPCGLLGAYLGSTLQFPDKNLFFRNLDGEGTLYTWPKGTDFRGKTILNKATLVSSVAMGGTVLQNYAYELSIDGDLIYKGTASFGFFPADALAQQVGLDKGQPSQPWYIVNNLQESALHRVKLDAGHKWLAAPADKPHYHLAGNQLHLLDELLISENGGKYDRGYVYAQKKVRSYDWFFTCHFYTDPVMPGSLGVEAMIEALQGWVLKTGLGSDLSSPRFVQLDNHHTSWKYRGQILQAAEVMKLEVHVKSVEKKAGEVIILADASLWNGQTRIYEVTDLGLGIQSTALPQRKVKDAAWEGQVTANPGVEFGVDAIRHRLTALNAAIYLVKDAKGRLGVSQAAELKPGMELVAIARAVSARQLGSAAFRNAYGVDYAYLTGAMANGIASEELVIAMGKAGFMGSFGAAGLPPQRVSEAIDKIQVALPNGPYAFNLIHSPNEEALESEGVRLFLEKGVRVVEASAFLGLTKHIVYYRVAGLYKNEAGEVVTGNKVIAKVSRREVAQRFMSPPPADMLEALVRNGKISAQQAEWAAGIPMADDITVEADSGGHTDNRPLVALLPSIIALRDEVQQKYGYRETIRVGAAGGISTPQSALAAFMMGADYVVTGSVNQACVEAGTSPHVREALAKATMTDIAMAPAADMFEMGVELQVLKKGSLFPMRAKKLYEYYRQYASIDEIPADERLQLEKQIFRKPLEEIWQDCISFFDARDPAQITRAENDPRRKMALIFRWYLGLSSHWANTGTAGRELDYQIWCGPSMGAFNDWVKGSYLEKPENRRAADVARHIMEGAAYYFRVRSLQMQGVDVPLAWEEYVPRWD